MTNKDLEKFKKASKAMLSKLNTPEKARAYLVRLGTHNVDGTLTKEYGG